MNTAGRILSIYDRLIGRGRGADLSMTNVWADVFDLSPDAPHLEDEVVTCLQATRTEMELLRAKLFAMGVGEELLHPGLTRLRNITSTTHLTAGWSGLRDEATKPENRFPLIWANWALRDESEEEMSLEDFAALRAELDALENSLQEVDISPYLRNFTQRQIDAIRSALRVYRVQGIKPIEEALRKVAGDYTIEKANIEAERSKASEPAKSVFSRMGTLIGKTAKTADDLDKIRKGAEGTWTLASSIVPTVITWMK